jgi:hypothetical protein
MTSDGNFLYIPARGGGLVRKINKTGSIIEEIPVPTEGISSGLVWTGSHFWGATDRGNLTKYTHDWQAVGQIYPVADGSWAMAWDGDYIWTLQRTCESWEDEKLFQIEPLISTITNYTVIKEDTNYSIIVKSNSSDWGLRYNLSRNEISFEIYGRAGTTGFCDVLIPKAVISGFYAVSIDGIRILPIGLIDKETNVLIHFEYDHSYHEIKIYLERGSVGNTIPGIHILPLTIISIGLISIWVRKNIKGFDRKV